MAELATIARPYAEALFQVASKGQVSEWTREVDVLAAIAANADLRQFADNPKVSAEQVFSVISATSGPLSEGVQNFLRTILENGRLAALGEIAAQFRNLCNAQTGVAEACVYSAYEISAEQLASLLPALEQRFGHKLDAKVVLEPSLIGGVRVVVGDEVLDTSVQARLERMKAALAA